MSLDSALVEWQQSKVVDFVLFHSVQNNRCHALRDLAEEEIGAQKTTTAETAKKAAEEAMRSILTQGEPESKKSKRILHLGTDLPR